MSDVYAHLEAQRHLSKIMTSWCKIDPCRRALIFIMTKIGTSRLLTIIQSV